MNKLTKAQKDQLIAVVMGTITLVGLLWYFGINSKNAELAKAEGRTRDMRGKLADAEGKIKTAAEVSEKLAARTNLLDRAEASLAPDRDAYAWIIVLMNEFLKTHKGVNLKSYSKPDITDQGVIPNFPYKWATFHLGGTGYFHDLGKFFADLENTYPYFKVENLELSSTGVVGAAAEEISVHFDLIIPVKPSDTK